MNKRSEHRGRSAGNYGKASGTGGTTSSLHDNGDPHLAYPASLPPWAIASDVGLVRFDVPFEKRSWKAREPRSKLVKQ